MLIARASFLCYNEGAYDRRLTKSYTYDPNPAVTSDTSYTYNITYDYDNSGRLIREYWTGAYTFTSGFSYTREFIYLYDENEIIGVLHSYNGAALKPYYFHKNLQGDVIAICDENGNVVAEYAYDAWGNCTIKRASNSDIANYNPIRYRGYYYDREMNLYLVGGRYYDPTCGRFISPDSTSNLNPSAHVGLNLYLYAGNDPVNGVYGGGESAGASASGDLQSVVSAGYPNEVRTNKGNNWSSLRPAPQWIGKALDIASFGFDLSLVARNAWYTLRYPSVADLMKLDGISDLPGKYTNFVKAIGYVFVLFETGLDIYSNYQQGQNAGYIFASATYTLATGVGVILASEKLGSMIGGLIGGPAGVIIGGIAGLIIGFALEELAEKGKELIF